jgi:Zn-finger nucleic acid-binding protein
MKEIHLLGHNVDLCERCKSVFLDKDELALTKGEEVDGFEKEEIFGKRDEKVTDFKCPKCAGEMDEYVFAFDSGIYIDRCQDCGGIFLDEGELLAIDNFLERAEKEELPDGLLDKLHHVKHKVNKRFEQMKEEQDELYKIIDEVPGIGFVANFLGKFL